MWYGDDRGPWWRADNRQGRYRDRAVSAGGGVEVSILFRLSQVSYRYPGAHLQGPQRPAGPVRLSALEGIDLTIKRGERLAVSGENGAGKSTLLRLLSGVVAPSSGTLLYCGAERGARALLFQDPDDQLFCSTIYEDLAFGPFNMGLDSSETNERIEEVSALLGIGPYLEKAPWELSFGQKKLCALGTILTMRPEVLLLDEPTAGLDSKGVSRVVHAVESFKGTVICISHDLDILKRVCHRIIVLKKGRLVQELDLNNQEGLDEFSRALGADHSIRAPILRRITSRFRHRFVDSGPDRSIAVEVKGLCCSYGGRSALRDVSLQIRKGEHVALIGENGAGKTTLLKAVQGALPIDRGIIRIKGREPREYGSGWNGIGMVLQESSLQLICPSVLEEVAFGPRQLGLPEKEVGRRVERAVSAMGLSDYLDRVPQNLSGGEKKRVAIASIISMEPEIYILDEPSASLDQETEALLVEFFRDTEATVILATHHLRLVRQLAERVLIMEEGRLSADLPAERFLELFDAETRARSEALLYEEGLE